MDWILHKRGSTTMRKWDKCVGWCIERRWMWAIGGCFSPLMCIVSHSVIAVCHRIGCTRKVNRELGCQFYKNKIDCIYTPPHFLSLGILFWWCTRKYMWAALQDLHFPLYFELAYPAGPARIDSDPFDLKKIVNINSNWCDEYEFA